MILEFFGVARGAPGGRPERRRSLCDKCYAVELNLQILPVLVFRHQKGVRAEPGPHKRFCYPLDFVGGSQVWWGPQSALIGAPPLLVFRIRNQLDNSISTEGTGPMPKLRPLAAMPNGWSSSVIKQPEPKRSPATQIEPSALSRSPGSSTRLPAFPARGLFQAAKSTADNHSSDRR